MPVNVILAIGFDSLTFESQRVGCSSAGNFVTPAASTSEGLKLFREGDFDAVLLGGLLSAERRERIIAFIRSMGSKVPVLCASEASHGCGTCESLKAYDEPEALMRRVGQLLADPQRAAPSLISVDQVRRAPVSGLSCIAEMSRSGIRRRERRATQVEFDMDRLPLPIPIDSPCFRGGNQVSLKSDIRGGLSSGGMDCRASSAG